MKRWILAFSLMAVSAVLANVLYTSCRPEKSDAECTMDWLTEQLALTPAQREIIWSAHTRHCPVLENLCARLLQCDSGAKAATQQSCQQATRQLITEVCAKLSPAQREKYLRLVSTCLPPADSAMPQTQH